MSGRTYYTDSYMARSVGTVRASCDRCGGRARFYYGGDAVCASCRGLKAAWYRNELHTYAGSLGLSVEDVARQLGGESGRFVVRATSAPPARLVWAEAPVDAAAAVVAGPRQRLGVQLALVSRVLWGVALLNDQDLSSCPRDAFSADCLSFGLCAWAHGSDMAYRWLLVYAFRLRAEWYRRHGSDHAASDLVVWLACNAGPRTLGALRGGWALPPNYRSIEE